MKTIILYTTYSGNTKDIATKKAAELQADIEEITLIKKVSLIKGIHQARRSKHAKINDIKANLADYEKIILMAPVWWGYPVAAFNSMVKALPEGKVVELVLVSGGGGTKKSAAKVKHHVEKTGCTIESYTDLKAKKNKKTGEIVVTELSKAEDKAVEAVAEAAAAQETPEQK